MIKVFITNLAEYNKGGLVGEWVSLPLPANELKEIMGRISFRSGVYEGDELFISDYEAPCSIYMYEDIEQLNELTAELDTYVQKHGEAVVEAALREYPANIERALKVLDREDFKVWEEVHDETTLGLALLEDCDIPEWLRPYVDFEQYGSDCIHDGITIYPDLNIAVCWG